MGRENEEVEAMPTCYCPTCVLLALSSYLAVFSKLCFMNIPLYFLLLLCQSRRRLRNVSFGGRILVLIKSACHGWLNMMTSSEASPIFSLASGSPNLKPTTGWEQCQHRQLRGSSISTFLTSAVTDLLTARKFNLPTPETAFLFILWSSAIFSCKISASRFPYFFLDSLQKRCSAPADSCLASHANSISHSSSNLLQISYAVYQSLDASAWLKTHNESSIQLFHNFWVLFHFTHSALRNITNILV